MTFYPPIKDDGGLNASFFERGLHLVAGCVRRRLRHVDVESLGVGGGAFEQIGDDARPRVREHRGAIPHERVAETRDTIAGAGALLPEIRATVHQHLLRLFKVRFF